MFLLSPVVQKLTFHCGYCPRVESGAKYGEKATQKFMLTDSFCGHTEQKNQELMGPETVMFLLWKAVVPTSPGTSA